MMERDRKCPPVVFGEERDDARIADQLGCALGHRVEDALIIQTGLRKGPRDFCQRFHLAGIPANSFFCLLKLGNILHGAKYAEGFARFFIDDLVPGMYKSDIATPADDAVFHIIKLAAFQRFIQCLLLQLAVIGMN